MDENNIFRVDYPTGYIEVNVGNFFGTADKKKIKKLLKLAKQHCTDSQREDLVRQMHSEADRRTAVLDALGELEYRRKELLHGVLPKDSYFSIERPLPTPEKALVKQRDKLRQIAEDLSKVRWDE